VSLPAAAKGVHDRCVARILQHLLVGQVPPVGQLITLVKVKRCAVRLHSVHKHPALGLFLCVRVSLVNLRPPFQRQALNLIQCHTAIAALLYLANFTTAHKVVKVSRCYDTPGQFLKTYADFSVDYFHSFYYLCGLLLQELSL
jgi:hypothetical protein